MLLLQMTGLSGAGKSTIAEGAKIKLMALGYKVELLDGEDYRNHLCQDLGFSKADRLENMRRLGFVGLNFAKHDIITILATINPYEEARQNLRNQSDRVKTVFISCPLSIAAERDPKGLYQKALLPRNDPQRIPHFTGVSDPFELPKKPDLVVHTDKQNLAESVDLFVAFVLDRIRVRQIMMLMKQQPAMYADKRLVQPVF
jgi:adenylylsulfate kinase